MQLSILIVFLALWNLVIAECWKANIQNGVRCKDVFQKTIASSKLECFRKCLQTSRCCYVNYVNAQENCEYCSTGPTNITTDASSEYIGYTIYQKNCKDPELTNSCAEFFDNLETAVNATENATQNLCFDKKENFNKSFSTLTDGGSCLRWDDPDAFKVFPDSYFTADGNSKSSALNYCRHPTLSGTDLHYYSAPYLYCNHDDPYIEKAMCAVRSCDSTDLDQCGTPPSLPSLAVRSYPVVGDVYLAYYKCSSLSGNTPSPHCPVSRCTGISNWTTPSISCSNKDCYPSGQHASYTGKRTCTESGRTCQAWALNTPHAHGSNSLRADPSNGNYCRGTSGEKPWCYTTDPDMRWETCNVPEC